MYGRPMDKPKVGSIGWMDITVPDAEVLKDFYSNVVGWKPEPISMGDYSDYAMKSEGGTVGICHARGSNVGLPPVWLPYFIVEDLDAALANSDRLGGTRIGDVRSYGPTARFCVIRDPQGAHCVLFQS
jgi:predicted enzyme related to lactoylglutathione lyase